MGKEMTIIIGDRAYTVNLTRYGDGYGASIFIPKGDEYIPVWSDDQDYEFPSQAVGSVVANLYDLVVPPVPEEVDQTDDSTEVFTDPPPGGSE